MQVKQHAAFRYFALGFLVASVLFNSPAILLRGRLTGSNTSVQSKSGVKHSSNQEIDEELFSDDGPRQNNNPPSIKSINLIGERHCGTKWITNHLEDCFGDQVEVFNRYSRWKHWFQNDDGRNTTESRNLHRPKSSLVVAMFRDPYSWVESMRVRPYHSPSHFDLDWKEFVTTPWTMDRGHGDQQLIESGSQNNATCMHRFSFNEIVPCSNTDRNMFKGTFNGKPVGVTYELNHDGSGQPYKSIIDLRRDKIKNFLEVAGYHGVGSFLPVQFEFMVTRGTSELIDEIERITGLTANCARAPPHPLTPKDLDEEFITWMNDNVDWEVEKLIGYSRRDS